MDPRAHVPGTLWAGPPLLRQGPSQPGQNPTSLAQPTEDTHCRLGHKELLGTDTIRRAKRQPDRSAILTSRNMELSLDVHGETSLPLELKPLEKQNK